MHFVALDVVTNDRAQLRRPAAEVDRGGRADERRRRGHPRRRGRRRTRRRRLRTPGRRSGCPPPALTLTVGFGPSLFDDRFGLADRRPAALADLPAFPGDDLDPARSGGDICIQACANDPQVAVHAVRNLIRMGFGIVSVRWSQLGFGRTSSTSHQPGHAAQPVRVQGRHQQPQGRGADGSSTSTSGCPADGDGPAAWMAGGTYLVARRIRMHIEIWDRTSLPSRRRWSAATRRAARRSARTEEFDEPDFAKQGTDGEPVIDVEAHIRLAPPESTWTGSGSCAAATTSPTAATGWATSTPGCSSSPSSATRSGSSSRCSGRWPTKDVMMEYIEHTGSALFACPPGVAEGGYWGDALFA